MKGFRVSRGGCAPIVLELLTQTVPRITPLGRADTHDGSRRHPPHANAHVKRSRRCRIAYLASLWLGGLERGVTARPIYRRSALVAL